MCVVKDDVGGIETPSVDECGRTFNTIYLCLLCSGRAPFVHNEGVRLLAVRRIYTANIYPSLFPPS